MVDRKEQILELAAELLQSRSFTSFSYQDLSERLGLSKASIHHHFSTKEELLLALAERYQERQRRRRVGGRLSLGDDDAAVAN